MKSILNTYNTTELKKIISSTNIKGYSKLKKNDLVNFMTKKEHIHHFKHIKERIKPLRKNKSKLIKNKTTIALTPQKKNNISISITDNKKSLTNSRKKKLLKKGYGIQKKRNVATTKKTEDFLGSIETTYSPKIPHETVYEDFANAPTYDTGYDVDMSQMIDPLTFDYTTKTPIFYKGIIPFDKKKHDKGIMPKEIWEGIYGEDLDTPKEIIRGNNLTPEMKEDIKLTELKAKHELNKTKMKKRAEDKVKYAEKGKLQRQKHKSDKIALLPPVPQNKLEVVGKRKRKGYAPKIVARSKRGAKRSKAQVIESTIATPIKTTQALTIFNKDTFSNQGGNQLHPDFRREQKRMGYTDYNMGQKVYENDGGNDGKQILERDDWEEDPTHPQYQAPIKHSYSHLGVFNRSGVVSGRSGINQGSDTQIRIRGRETKQEDGQATNNQKSKLNAGLLAGIERQKLKKKGIIVRLNNDSVFTKKGKQEFADKFIIQAKNVDKKMSKEWIKRYVETKRKERPNKEYGNKTEAFNKMAEEMFNDYDKESKKSRPLMLKGKDDKFQSQKKAFQDKFNIFNKKAQADLKGNILTPAKKRKLKEQLEQKKKRLEINLKKLGEKFNK